MTTKRLNIFLMQLKYGKDEKKPESQFPKK